MQKNLTKEELLKRISIQNETIKTYRSYFKEIEVFTKMYGKLTDELTKDYSNMVECYKNVLASRCRTKLQLIVLHGMTYEEIP